MCEMGRYYTAHVVNCVKCPDTVGHFDNACPLSFPFICPDQGSKLTEELDETETERDKEDVQFRY